jgi:hypothetical protein
MLRTVRVPASRIRQAALLEDEASIQVSLMEVVNALLRGTIELKRAELILRALNTAVRNIKRVKFDLHSDEMVREIPNYPAPPIEDVDEVAAAAATLRAVRAESARETAAFMADYNAALAKHPAQPAAKNATPATATPPNGNTNAVTPAQVKPHLGAAAAATAVAGPASVGAVKAPPTHVGTAAPGCPGGPAVSGRSAVPPKPAAPAKVTPRKPAASVKPELPKERKTAAHRRGLGS